MHTNDSKGGCFTYESGKNSKVTYACRFDLRGITCSII